MEKSFLKGEQKEKRNNYFLMILVWWHIPICLGLFNALQDYLVSN